MVLELSRRDARRAAVRAQLLIRDRPVDALAVVRHLGLVQMDLTAHVAPNADLVLWSRLGSAYSPDVLDDLLESRAIVEHLGYLRPAEDIALFRAQMAAWPGVEPLSAWRRELEAWVEANRACRDAILTLLRSEGPLPAREIPDTCVVPWRSSGWTNSKNVQRMLDLMEQRGEVAVSSRENRERTWDLAPRVHPDGPTVPFEEAERERDRRRLAALGIARARVTFPPGEPNHVGEAGVEAVVEGVRGRWRVDPAALEGGFSGRTALLSPLDRLVFDRKRMAELFEFDYQLEMYKPAASRRWGYFALPVLHGDRLVGKVDAHRDAGAGVLRVAAVHWDEEPTGAMRGGVERELRSLAGLLEVELMLPSGWSSADD
ncbi:crosslink repair DNA glycosylase YcaQ family protein [Arthrobacter sp. NEB 688]|uniref:DNA glycosylase AlkZ-like family protein n=1 Tax=Arthrobacter sp. NEB 688 TaxID=904039 RepID=UPI001566A46C|nr:crosslink repair DNA glycosylase YcaQ family protein [Arthrobacter sp. NEB 688]QKE83779.1 winged helix-turn-helix domain-containing protein [Arthrobacter sp. NEB 688]